jgi:protein-disulfide isomerase
MRFLRSVIISSVLLGSSICLAASTPTSNNVANNAVDNASFNPAQVQKIEQIIHDYLLKNPKILVEAIQTLQKQAMADEQKHVAEIKDLSNKHIKEIFDVKTTGHVVTGSSQPKVIVAEFFGYQCPICRATSPAMDKIMQDNKDAQIIFIPWTFEGDADIYAAQTSLAIQQLDKNKFLSVHKTLLGLSGILTKEQVDKVAKDNGIDMEKLSKIRDDQTIINGIKANFKLAQDLNLIGTPSIFVTNQQQTKLNVLPGRASAEEIQKAINDVR